MAAASMDLNMPIIFDVGAGLCKAGFAGDASPRAVFPSIVGRPQHQAGRALSTEFHVGEDAYVNSSSGLPLHRLIILGTICNWDDLEKIWNYTFHKELRTKPEDHPVLLTEPILPFLNARLRMAEIMFERFNVPALSIMNQAVLAAHATGRRSCLCVDIGECATHVLGVYEGRTIPPSAKRLDLAGRDLTYALSSRLKETDYTSDTVAMLETVRRMKDELSYITLDCERETRMASRNSETVDKVYKLPDGQTITVGKERFICGECLFKPVLVDPELSTPGLHKVVLDCIKQCPAETRRELLRNVVISGGTSMCPGLGDRLEKEIRWLIRPRTWPVKVIAYEDRKYAVWNGSSVIACSPTFRDRCISKQEYEETGPNIVPRKCGDSPAKTAFNIIAPE